MENTTFVSLDDDVRYNHLHGERGVTQKIKRAMYDAAKQFVYIGFLLYEVKKYEYFYEGDYESVYQYAEAELGFKRSSTKNFIAIAETFGTVTRGGEKLQTMSLQKEYSDYSYSQLTEMLAMTPAQREKTSPKMTIKQLRELKKQPDPKQDLDKSLEALDKIIKKDGQTSGQIKKDEYGKGIQGKQIKDPDPNKWYDATWQVPAAYDRKLKLIIQIWNPHNKQYGIGYYNNQEGQWHDQHGNNIKVANWMELPHMP